MGGTFPQSIHWTLEKFINELGKRRRHLAFLMMPPDASWPLISQMSRRHEYNDLTTRTSYHMFEGDLVRRLSAVLISREKGTDLLNNRLSL